MDQLSPVAAGPLTVRKDGGGGGGGGVTQAGEPLMTASTNLEHMELSIARDTTSLANTAHVSHAGGQKMFAFKSPQHRKQTSTAEPPPHRRLNRLLPLGSLLSGILRRAGEESFGLTEAAQRLM